jgi:hypothetical protein
MTTLKEYFDGWGEEVPSSQEKLADVARWIRNAGLKETDWTQMPDSPLSEQKKLEFSNYRSELRDLDFADIDPLVFTFPVRP